MPKTEKKRRAPKDPNKPKRGKSAFMFFSIDKRPSVVEANPNLSFGEIGKELGRLWGDLTAEEKKPYQEQAEADKERFQEESQNYSGPTDKKTKDPNKPKRGMSAFMFFSQEHRNRVVEENPDLSFGAVGKKLGELWKELPEDERKPYEQRADEDKIRYQDEMKEYQPPGLD